MERGTKDHCSLADSSMDYFPILTRGQLGTQKSVMVKNQGFGIYPQITGYPVHQLRDLSFSAQFSNF